MVLQKRLDYGFNGFQVPAVPRSTRSARGRRLFKRKVEDSQMCAFELLATVAGDLLQEKETSHSPGNALAGTPQPAIVKDAVKQGQQDQGKLLKVEPCDPGSCDESVCVLNVVSQGHNQSFTLKESIHAPNNKGSTVTNSDLLEKANCVERNRKNGNHYVKLSSKVTGSAGYKLSCKDKFAHGIEQKLAPEEQKTSSLVKGISHDTYCLEYLMDVDNKPPALISSDSSAEAPLCRNHIPCNYFPEARDDVKLVSKDDDENSSECTQPSTITTKALRPPPRIGDRRIRKLLASKYWRVAPKLKDRELSNPETRTVFRNRKSCYTRQRSQRFSPYGRRKLFEHSSSSMSDGAVSSKGISNSPEKGVSGDATASGSQASSSVAGQESSSHSSGSHVKLSIKSFRVPELFIEVSEMETVGSLKRTVMEAVTAILGGGLRVGIVLQGKKIRDDSKTLLQTGISHHDKLDSLGFMLEPNPTPTSAPPPLCNGDPPVPVPCEIQNPLSRCPTAPALDHGPSDSSSYPPLTNLSNLIESDRDSVPSPTNISVDKTTTDSRALVAIPTRVEALAVVPLQRKSRRSELVQRRIRRPFSVLEVEALVQAVEKLGTGRWRDVKLCAFDCAKHRTYVDLKDKWKTLVHTARISPQQRRGEPVPQELLDRVLAAHAYWSQQQAKAQVKQQNDQYLL